MQHYHLQVITLPLFSICDKRESEDEKIFK